MIEIDLSSGQVLRTSAEWQNLLKAEILVYDPDGWDRQNYEFSWNVEQITREEFMRRAMMSTCLRVNPALLDPTPFDPLKSLCQSANNFAVDRHDGQMYGDKLYAYHLDMVATLCRPYGYVVEAAAWLHDIIEDKKATRQEVRSRFGKEIYHLVDLLTDPPGKNRAERKAKAYPRIKSDERAVLIKLHDQYANIKCCIEDQNGRLLGMYLREHKDFYLGLYDPTHAQAGPVWDEMGELIEQALVTWKSL
jgi:hypothetical protein